MLTLVQYKAQVDAAGNHGEWEYSAFTAPGVYEYVCGLHPVMKGSVEVK